MEGETYEAICAYKESGSYPHHILEMADKNEAKQQKRNFRRKCEAYTFKEGVLNHIPTSKKPNSTREVPREGDRARIIRAFHGNPAGGCHFGVTATFNKLSERCYWKGMYDAVQTHVNACEECQRQNTLKKGPSQLHPVPFPDYCFGQWGMDLVGPLKATPGGNQYIIVFTEYLSRWAEAKPLPDKTAVGVASALIECVVSRFGCPSTIISDQGREFVNVINQELCRDLDISRNLCSAYHPQSNGLTERLNQTLVHQLRKLVNESMDNWDSLIPWVLMSYRANRQASTKFSPFVIVYGQQMRLPIEVDGEQDHESQPYCDADEEKMMSQRMERIKGLPSFRTACKSNITAAEERQKQQYDAKQQPATFKVGDLVWYRNTRRDTRKGGKLESVWVAKAIIEEVLAKGTYRLEGLARMYNAANLQKATTGVHAATIN